MISIFLNSHDLHFSQHKITQGTYLSTEGDFYHSNQSDHALVPEDMGIHLGKDGWVTKGLHQKDLSLLERMRKPKSWIIFWYSYEHQAGAQVLMLL